MSVELSARQEFVQHKFYSTACTTGKRGTRYMEVCGRGQQ
jgi:hypothetical protein